MMGSSETMSTDEVVDEIMRLHRSLPSRPGIEEVEAAKTLIRNVEKEQELRLESIGKQYKRRNKDVPDELYQILQEMQRNTIQFQCREQMREALRLLEVENVHLVFDDLVQRASKCINPDSDYQPSNGFTPSVAATTTATSSSSSSGLSNSFGYSDDRDSSKEALLVKDDLYVKKPKMKMAFDGVDVVRSLDGLSEPKIVDPTLKPHGVASAQDGEKFSLIKLASLIEVSAKKGSQELILEGKLSDQVEWLPDSIGKLSSLIRLNLSENRITVLPVTIGCLSSLQLLDLHGNKITELPESIGDLLNLLNLDLRGNQLKTLPASISRLTHLEELDLSSNGLSVLPEAIGSLVNLKKLDVETNDLEEIPHTIGRCTSLKELHVDYNHLKALPEALGRIESLEILTVRYNNIRQLPTTTASLTSLRELDVSFNEIESIPESLCFATTLVKLNISNNFADLQSLPRSIGNLEMLEELDMSNNQIRVLPESFRMLTKLRVLKVEGNPLFVPPRDVIEKGPQAVVQYMADVVSQKEVRSQPVKKKKSWIQMCCFSNNKRKRSGDLELNA